MTEYLIIQANGRTEYAGEGESNEWRKKLGREPDEKYYFVINITVSPNADSQALEITYNHMLKEEDYRPVREDAVYLQLQLDSKLKSLLEKILKEEK